MVFSVPAEYKSTILFLVFPFKSVNVPATNTSPLNGGNGLDVGVGVGVIVLVGVIVGVIVGVGVTVLVGVTVGVIVGVILGVGVGDGGISEVNIA